MGVAESPVEVGEAEGRFGSGFDGGGAGGKPDGGSIEDGPGAAIHICSAAPGDTDTLGGVDAEVFALRGELRDDGGGAGEERPIGAEDRVLEVERDAREGLRGEMDQLEQLGAGLLLGGVDVLIALDDVDVDGELVGARAMGDVALRRSRVALRTEVPDGGRVLDQKREVVLRRAAGGARAASAPILSRMRGVEAVVDMGEHEIEMRAALRE